MDSANVSPDKIVYLVLFSAVIIGGLYFVFQSLMKRDLGIDLWLDNRNFKAGEMIPVKICIAPKRDIKVNKVTASVYCVVGSHPHRQGATELGRVSFSTLKDNEHRASTYETQHYSEVTLCGSQIFKANSEQVIEGRLQIDPSGHGTRDASRLDRNWFLTIDVDIPQCPDVKLKEEIQVSPRFA